MKGRPTVAKKKGTRKKAKANKPKDDVVHEALTAAFTEKVRALYDVYLSAVIGGDDLDAAEARYRRGLTACRQALADTIGFS